MRRPLAAALLLGLLLASGCAEIGWPGTSAPPPAQPAATPPPPPRTEVVVRRAPWLARNFDELAPPQQTEVERRMARSRQAPSREAARIRWDTLGLEERRSLMFPTAARTRRLPRPPTPPAPPPRGAPDGS